MFIVGCNAHVVVVAVFGFLIKSLIIRLRLFTVQSKGSVNSTR